MDQRELEKVTNEADALDADSSRVSALLRALPRAEAPANFEFRVKAGIAAGTQQASTRRFPGLKIAVPLSLVLLVAASVIFYGWLPADSSGPTVADAVPERPVVQQPNRASQEETRTDVPVPAPTTERAGTQMQKVAAEPNRSGPVRRPAPVRSQAGRRDGSIETALTAANVIDAPGIKSNLGRNPNANVNDPREGAGISVSEILQTLGLKAKFVNGGWMVHSITGNSVAARSGVKVNDVVEALGDQTLGESSTLKDGFKGKALRVRREGKQITIEIKN